MKYHFWKRECYPLFCFVQTEVVFRKLLWLCSHDLFSFSLAFFVVCSYVHVCVSVCVCVLACAHVPTEARGCCWCLSLLLSVLAIETESLTRPGAREFSCIGWLSISQVVLSLLQCWGYMHVTSHPVFKVCFVLIWVLGIQTQFFACVVKIYWLSHLPSPFSFSSFRNSSLLFFSCSCFS